MHHLFVIILSALFFVAPLRGDQADLNKKRINGSIKKLSTEKGLVDFAAGDDQCDADINCSTRRSNSNSQHRTYPLSNFILSTKYDNRFDFFYLENCYLLSKVYFKPIALKLVFPEHYFW